MTPEGHSDRNLNVPLTNAWFRFYSLERVKENFVKNIGTSVEVLKEAKTFFPATKHVFHISLDQLCTTNFIEKSFNTKGENLTAINNGRKSLQ